MTTLFKKYGPAVVMGVLSIALPQIALPLAPILVNQPLHQSRRG